MQIKNIDKYDLVIFDLSGVIFTNGMQTALPEISKQTGRPLGSITELFKNDTAKKYFTGKISSEEFWQGLARELGLSELDSSNLESNRIVAKNAGQFRDLWFAHYNIIQKNFDYVSQLKNRGVKTVCLSESPQDRVDYHQKKYQFLKAFDYTVFSYETGSTKPSVELFDLLMQKIKHNPADSLYVDDDPRNLVIARELGYATILHKD